MTILTPQRDLQFRRRLDGLTIIILPANLVTNDQRGSGRIWIYGWRGRLLMDGQGSIPVTGYEHSMGIGACRTRP